MDLSEQFNSFALSSPISSIAQDICKIGGELFLVWWCVRDMILWIQPNDLDIEVYWLNYDSLDIILNKYGQTFAVWKSFGILKLHIQGIYVDFSLPRKDSKIKPWHTWFQVEINGSLSFYEASRRRDFTMNSILYNPLSNTIVDPYNGCKDIHDGILRITDMEKFLEDPLRVYRAVRFIWRFWLKIERESLGLLKTMVWSLSELSKERIGDEWRKIFLQSNNIRKSLELFFELGILDTYYPCISWLKNIPQDKKWHPEWDVWIHTCMVIEQAQWIAIRENFSDEEKIILYLSALCHDFWKITHTQINEDGKITAYWHEEAWIIPTKLFLQELFFSDEIIEKIIRLITYHVTPSIWYHDNFFKNISITDGAFRKLAKKMYPANLKELSYLCEADMMGRWELQTYRNTRIERVFLPWNWFRARSDKLWVDTKPAQNILNGKDLIQLGMSPWVELWKTIEYANYLYDDLWIEKDEIIKKIQEEIIAIV